MPQSAQIPIRVTDALRERIMQAAAANDRSMTQEIARRLEASFDYQDAADYLRQTLSRLAEVLTEPEGGFYVVPLGAQPEREA